jgi:hydrogenase maturation protease
MGPRILVIGVGNEYRGDDSVGVIAARRLKDLLSGQIEVRELGSDVSGLLESLKSRDAAIILDAARSGAPPGTIHRFVVGDKPIPEKLFCYSSHAFSVGEALKLARALHQMPDQVIVYGIEGAHFEFGRGLTPEVERAVHRVITMVVEDTQFLAVHE